MSDWVRGLRIEGKLRLVMMLTATAALVAAGLAYGISDYTGSRRSLVGEVSSLATVVATHSVAALEFSDEAVAQETLDSLRLRENIAVGALFDTSGTRVAAYVRAGERAHLPDRLPAAGRESFERGRLQVVREVRHGGRWLGSVYLEADLSALHDRMAGFGLTTLLVMALSALVSLVVASWLQKFVSRPILQLVEVVNRVSEERDYSVRVPRESEDELGLLVDGFNQMIERVREHHAERDEARREVELHAEELARSNAELDDFAYIASHDLKEPLRGIHNYARFLLDDHADALDEEGRRLLETLPRLTTRMERLIDSLLHYSRVGRTREAVRPTDLDEVLRDVVERLGPRLEERGVQVSVPTPLPVVHCDSVRSGELFQNLLTNAIKYTDHDHPCVELSWKSGGAPSGARLVVDAGRDPAWPVITVQDNGIGIRERHLETVFRMFKRLHARERYGGGTGAGLSIVKKIVERHGGALWVESTFGQGTTFHFSIGELCGSKSEVEDA